MITFLVALILGIGTGFAVRLVPIESQVSTTCAMIVGLLLYFRFQDKEKAGVK